MDEVLGAIADAVSQLVIAFADSEEKNTLFGDMVPPAEVIQGAVQVRCLTCRILTFFCCLIVCWIVLAYI